MASEIPPVFKVSYPAAVLQQLADWGSLAKTSGLREEYIAAVRELRSRLESDPRSFGDPLWNIRGMKGELYRSYGRFFMAFYFVHVALPYVLVEKVLPTPHSPLEVR